MVFKIFKLIFKRVMLFLRRLSVLLNKINCCGIFSLYLNVSLKILLNIFVILIELMGWFI